MADIDAIWQRIRSHAGETFRTKTGLPFTYAVLGNVVRVTRGASEINRSLSRTNFQRALDAMPADGPGALRERQGSAYTWAILMDSRVRAHDW